MVNVGKRMVTVVTSNTSLVDDENTVRVEKMVFVSIAVITEYWVEVVKMVDEKGPMTKGTVTKNVWAVS